jgi:Metallo-peptidase family M12
MMLRQTNSKMSLDDLSSIFDGLLNKDSILKDDGSRFFFNTNRNEYQLVNISLVYHLLPQQGVGAEVARQGNNETLRTGPIMTDAQRDFATKATNRLYQIYDKKSKQSLQFASFVTYPTTIVHDDFITTKDCTELSPGDIESIVTVVPGWEYRMHVIVCELASISGRASFPTSYIATDPQHNVAVVDYRALACYDDQTGTYLCNNTITNTNISHTRWWRTRSTVVAHEFGHLFGLEHTFAAVDSCTVKNSIPDIPRQSSPNFLTFGCPGLLPYNKDRNLFRLLQRKNVNGGANSATCGIRSNDDVCGSTCAACCESAGGSCPTLLPDAQSVTEDMTSSPDCCTDNTPLDSCRFRRGIDPLNNIMSYVPDFCIYEFTVGQMARMMSRIRQYKPYIYCNYGNRLDTATCQNVPCTSFATGVNCVAAV